MTDIATLEEVPAEISELEKRVAIARLRAPLESDPALYSELTRFEQWQERRAARKVRAVRRRERRKAALAEVRAEQIGRNLDAVASVEVRRLRTYSTATWTSRGIILLIAGALGWSAFTVQRNLAGGLTPADPQWWLGFFIEATISGFVVAIMVLNNVATVWGRTIDRKQIFGFEIALMTAAVALNTGPYLANGDWGTAMQHSVAPIMVGVGMWLHGWISRHFAELLKHAESVDTLSIHPADLTAAPKPSSEPEGAELKLRELAGMIVEETIERHSPIWNQPDMLNRIITTVEEILVATQEGQPIEETAQRFEMQPNDVAEVIARGEAILREPITT